MIFVVLLIAALKNFQRYMSNCKIKDDVKKKRYSDKEIFT